MANAIVGSLMIVASCTLISTPIGVLAGFALAHLVVMRYVKTKYSGAQK